MSDKAVHIDDALFMWSAQWIQSHPADFYGATVNWDGETKSMYEVNLNPPLTAYVLALAGKIFGWNENCLHGIMGVFTVVAILGVYFLAGILCKKPAVATVIGIASPVFLVSASNLMSDIPILAFWTWAVYCWLRGCRECELKWKAGAVLMISCAILTKFPAINLILLLAAYSLIRNGKPVRELFWLTVPVVILLVYEWVFSAQYGRSHFLYSVLYSGGKRADADQLFALWLMTGLSFAGGCYVVVLFFAPLIAKIRKVWIGVGFTVVAMIFFSQSGFETWWPLLPRSKEVFWPTCVQLAVFSMCGIVLIACAISELRRFPDADAMLLGLWILGVFVFGTWINWSINGRTFLLMMPAVSIMLARRLEMRQHFSSEKPFLLWSWPLIPSICLSFLLAWSDYRMANDSRRIARELVDQYGGQSVQIWFSGHWGFQYYIQALGARPVDLKKMEAENNDILIVPDRNVMEELLQVPSKNQYWMELVHYPVFPIIATMDSRLGAGFYSYSFGPLPFALGVIPKRNITVIKLRS